MDDPTYRTLAHLANIGTVGVAMVTPIGLGLLADYYFGTMPVCAIVGALLGFGGGVYQLILLNRQSRT